MPRRKIDDKNLARAIDLRETQGIKVSRLARMFGVSTGALSYHFLRAGVLTPEQLDRGAIFSRVEPGAVVRRGNHVVRRFTPDEDAFLRAEKAKGRSLSAIGREMDPPRRPHTLLGRLYTLARHDELRDTAHDRDLRRRTHRRAGNPDRRAGAAGGRNPALAPAL
jgi:hypothetical protein